MGYFHISQYSSLLERALYEDARDHFHTMHNKLPILSQQMVALMRFEPTA